MEGERKMGNAEDGAEPIALDGKQMRMDALAESVFEVYVETIRGTGLDITPTAPAAVDERILGRVQSVLGSTFLTFFGITPRERYADVFEQISDFASRFAKDHIFPDGNKRTAVKMALAILGIVCADDAEDRERHLHRRAVPVGAEHRHRPLRCRGARRLPARARGAFGRLENLLHAVSVHAHAE